LDLAGLDCALADRLGSVWADDLQATLKKNKSNYFNTAAWALMLRTCQRWKVVIVSFGINNTYAVWK